MAPLFLGVVMQHTLVRAVLTRHTLVLEVVCVGGGPEGERRRAAAAGRQAAEPAAGHVLGRAARQLVVQQAVLLARAPAGDPLQHQVVQAGQLPAQHPLKHPGLGAGRRCRQAGRTGWSLVTIRVRSDTGMRR